MIILSEWGFTSEKKKKKAQMEEQKASILSYVHSTNSSITMTHKKDEM